MQKRYTMKKLLTLLTLALGFNLSASHLLGGYTQAIQRGYSDTVDITVTLFTDPQGISGPTSLTLTEYKLTNGFYQQNTTVSLTQQVTSTWQGVNVAIYSGYRVLTAGDYRYVYTNCCRGIHTNAASSMNSSFTMGLDYKKSSVPNSAPIIVNPLPINWVTGDTATSILFAVDPDGDSVMVEKDDALNQYANGVFVPLAPFSQLGNYGTYYVDANGAITWGPTTNGQFATGYKISEYRNGSLIGVNRIQQVYITQPGSTPNVPVPPVAFTQDLLNGDSLYVSILINNYTSTSLTFPGVNVTQASNTTWNLTDLQVGTYRGVLRASSNSSNNDYFVTLIVNSTIGIEENIADFNTQYKVYDWNGRYMGENINWAELKGLYVIRYNNGRVEKVLIQ